MDFPTRSFNDPVDHTTELIIGADYWHGRYIVVSKSAWWQVIQVRMVIDWTRLISCFFYYFSKHDPGSVTVPERFDTPTVFFVHR